MKDKEYHMANFATFFFQNSYFPPPPPQKMDEFNFKPAQYCINKIVLYLGYFKMDVLKW